MEWIQGGVCAPKGFTAAGIHCGIRKNKTKKDLALIYSACKASAASTYTQNKVKGAPIAVTKAHLQNGYAQAILCNSGNANTCNANGEEIANGMCQLLSEHLDVNEEDIIIASTGVIGQPLSMDPFITHMQKLVDALTSDGSGNACEGIMTTDTVKKEAAVSFELDGVTCHIGGIAKGSGMIHPNMATMLAFVTSDICITPEMLNEMVHEVVDDTFNMVSVDGDTSTNDMLSVLANGMAGNPMITCKNEAYQICKEALYAVCETISRGIAKDGEGASKLLTCHVTGAKDKQTARGIAKSIITSSLFKAAMFGKDANWGRILCAIGYASGDFDIDEIAVALSSKAGRVLVCAHGRGVAFSEEEALCILQEDEIIIDVDLHQGGEEAIAWGCDLTYDYVKINGDYRT